MRRPTFCRGLNLLLGTLSNFSEGRSQPPLDFVVTHSSFPSFSTLLLGGPMVPIYTVSPFPGQLGFLSLPVLDYWDLRFFPSAGSGILSETSPPLSRCVSSPLFDSSFFDGFFFFFCVGWPRSSFSFFSLLTILCKEKVGTLLHRTGVPKV